MIRLVRTDSLNEDFIYLVKFLDSELEIRDGEDHGFYSQFNTLANINHVVVAYHNNEPAGCGAIKKYSEDAAEIKRMFVLPKLRRKGIAAAILAELENWASEQLYEKCILETGFKQPEAIELYRRNGYYQIPNYDQYEGVETSICFAKNI